MIFPDVFQGNLCVWEVESGEVLHFLPSQRKFNICALAWNPHRDEVMIVMNYVMCMIFF